MHETVGRLAENGEQMLDTRIEECRLLLVVKLMIVQASLFAAEATKDTERPILGVRFLETAWRSS